MTDDIDLKPCPFCGCHQVFPEAPALGRHTWTVRCDDCDAEGPYARTKGDDGDLEAIDLWNARE